MEVKFVSAYYENSHTLEIQGTAREMKPYTERGYSVQYQNNGFWVLTKAAQIKLNVLVKDQIHTFRVKHQVVEFYRKSRVSEKLFENFLKDAQNGKIKFYISEHGVLTIAENS